MSTPVVELRELTRVFSSRFGAGDPVTALSSVSLQVPRGAIVALTGPNGAGKTTALEILATLLLPTAGAAFVDGVNVVDSPAHVRRLVAYCPAGSSSFWPRLTGRENLECFGALAGVGPADRARRLPEATVRVGLSDGVLAREVRTYSDGELQRLNLARALMRDVRVWLLDEPTRSLDADAQAATWALVREAARERGVSVLVATHDAVNAAMAADALVRLL